MLGALFSFEAVFVVFLFAGNYKADARLSWLPVDLSIGFFAIGFAMGLVIIYREGLYLPGLSLVAMAGAFVTWAALTSFWTPSTVYAQEKLIKLAVLNLWCLIATAMIMANRPERVRRLLLLLLVFGTATSLDGILQYRTTDQFALSASFRLENYIGQGRLYGMGALVAFALWLRTRPLSRQGLALMGVFATCAYAMLIAGSRGPLVSLAIAMMLPLIAGIRVADRRLLASRALLASLVLFILIAAVVTYLAIVASGSLRALQRFDVLLTAQEGGTSALRRLEFWSETLRFWLQTPVFGQGVGSWPVLYHGVDIGWHPHNLFLEVLSELGLIGFFLLAAVFAMACHRLSLARLRTEPALMTAVMLGVTAFLYAMTSGDLADNRGLFAMLGLLAMRSTSKVPRANAEHGRPLAQAAVAPRSPAFHQAIPRPRSQRW
jgi:O-antigen ligase